MNRNTNLPKISIAYFKKKGKQKPKKSKENQRFLACLHGSSEYYLNAKIEDEKNMYIREICYAGMTMEVCRYHAPNNRPRGMPRSKKEKLTREEQFRVNERQAEKKLRRLINHNFGPGDYHLVLTYRKEDRPEDKERLAKDIRNFHIAMKKAYKKMGLEYKYIHVYEIGKRGALHHHLVVNKSDVDVIRKIWGKGRIRVSPLDDSCQYSELASYLIKYSSVMLRSEEKLQGKRWNASRNLKKPKVIKKPVIRNTFRKKHEERKGWYIDKNMSCEYVDSQGYEHIQTIYIKTERKRE